MDNRNIDNASNSVVIVGAGPIGLAHAWGIKKLNPTISVTVFEKYEVYQRSHNLIMLPDSLEALMKAADAEKDPDLSKLLAQLKTNNHIRTNELESIFKNLAIKNGVDIINAEITPENIEEKLSPYNPALIIGADGTHSVVNRTLFPEGNQVKIPFDYVLQLRYEISSEEKPKNINAVNFYQDMARHGVIANEYVGTYNEENKKTSVTMQMMISETAFKLLEHEATSKRPITFTHEHYAGKIPDRVLRFIGNYLEKRSEYKGEELNLSSIKASVNEAPATYAKQPTYSENIPIVLVGDAALGLSYFKGLNAGLESTAKFFTLLKPVFIKNQLSNLNKLNKGFANYTNWFSNEFAPKKVREVEQYSTWRIRSPLKIMQTASFLKSSSRVEYLDDYNQAAFDYFLWKPSLARNEENNAELGIFPHRNHALVRMGQFSHVPGEHTATKIKKLFSDYFKPYKSSSQVIQDYKQPLVGLVNIGTGFGKFLLGAATLDSATLSDGFFSFIRGTLEIATTPLNWLIKPMIRLGITIIGGLPTIESMDGMKKLAQLGNTAIQEEKYTDDAEKYRLLALANDLHRKFDKAYQQGQVSDIKMEEQEAYVQFRKTMNNLDDEKNISHLNRYFSLFTQPAAKKLSKIPHPHQSRKENLLKYKTPQ